MKSLLIISCSNRKSRQPGAIPAMERYDGNTFRVIRKALRDGSIRPDLDIKIISAKFGLVDGLAAIPYYDQRITKARAEELKAQIRQGLGKCLEVVSYSEMYVDLGKDYLTALEGMKLPPNVKQTYAAGRIGQRLGSLKKWLRV
jgi:hypothetical protein